jgi:hypothetical protein
MLRCQFFFLLNQHIEFPMIPNLLAELFGQYIFVWTVFTHELLRKVGVNWYTFVVSNENGISAILKWQFMVSVNRRCQFYGKSDQRWDRMVPDWVTKFIFLNSDLWLTRLRAGRWGVRIPVGARDFSLQNVHTGTGAHLASYSVGTEVLF